MKRRLLWELRYRRDQFSVEAGRVKGRPDPDWLRECPLLFPGEEVYLEAFWTLRTEAPSSVQSVGRIPWSACMRYGVHELEWQDREMLRLLWRIVSAMDSGYLEWMKSEHDRYVRLNNSGNNATNNGRTARPQVRAS